MNEIDLIKRLVGKHTDAAVILVMATIIFCVGYNVISHSIEVWKDIPYIDREVHAVVVVDEYSECIFIVDGKRLITHEYPCEYKEGEAVITRTIGNTIYVYDERP